MPATKRKRIHTVDHNPQHVISRQPVIVHGVTDVRRGQSRTTIDGRVVQEPVDLFVRPEERRRPRPESARFAPDVMLKELHERLEPRIKDFLNRPSDGGVEFRSLTKLGFKPKIGAIGSYFMENRLYAHPFRLLRAMTTMKPGKSLWRAALSTKDAGVISYLRNTRNFGTVKGLREMKWTVVKLKEKQVVFPTKNGFYEIIENGKLVKKKAINGCHTMEKLIKDTTKRFDHDMHKVYKALKRDVTSGKVNANNQGDYLKRYEEALGIAENTFRHYRNLLLNAYTAEMIKANKKAGLSKHPSRA